MATKTVSRTTTPATVTPARRMFSSLLPWRDAWFDEFFNQLMPREDGNWLTDQMTASLDLTETDQTIEVRLDLPGVSPNEVDIQVENGMLIVRGQRQEEYEEGNKRQFHRIERRSGKFVRTISLPTAVNESEAVAEFNNGVLKIVMPKAEEAKAHRIPIKG